MKPAHGQKIARTRLCPFCVRVVALRIDGAFRTHRWLPAASREGAYERQRCAGSLRRHKVNHCCGIG